MSTDLDRAHLTHDLTVPHVGPTCRDCGELLPLVVEGETQPCPCKEESDAD